MLKLYQNNLIGYFKIGNREFGDYGFDTEERYKANKENQPVNWRYHTDRVFYDRNTYGHRSKEPTELNNNFIMFVGCSYTVGSAVALENTYPYLIANHHNVDYYNLAVEGSGVDLIAHNVVQWLVNVKKIPSRIYIQWPEITRTFRIIGSEVIPFGPWSDKTLNKRHDLKTEVSDYLKVVTTDFFDHNSLITKTLILNLCKAYNIDVVEINNFDILDLGRDLKHPGIESHNKLFEDIKHL